MKNFWEEVGPMIIGMGIIFGLLMTVSYYYNKSEINYDDYAEVKLQLQTYGSNENVSNMYRRIMADDEITHNEFYDWKELMKHQIKKGMIR